MKRYTYEEIASLQPCWLRDGRGDELRTKVGRGVTALQIARASGVTISDRRWVLVRLAARMEGGHQLLVLWAAGCAQDVRGRLSGDNQDAADLAIQTAVAWTEGAATQDECRAADAAAYAAYAAQLVTLARMMSTHS